MKIALAQLNYHIGNFEQNTSKMIEAIRNAKSVNTDLIIFSEFSICGYPPQDLLEQKDFIDNCLLAIKKIAEECVGIAAIVGGPVINPSPKGKKLFNTAFFLNDGKIQSEYYKTLLPTYDIFDEYRYFEQNTKFEVLEYKNIKFAITICEDLWDKQPVENSFAKDTLYVKSPMEELIKQHPDIIINIAASPFSYTQNTVRKNVLINNTKRYNIPILYVNQVGAQTEIIFDGNSMAISSKGDVVAELKTFDEDIQYFDYKEIVSPTKTLQLPQQNYIQQIHDALVLGIKDYFKKMGFTKALIGLSGGIDSAVTTVLAQRALGKENVRVVLMPSKFSSNHSITDSLELVKNINITHDIVNIQSCVDESNTALAPIFNNLPFDITEENIQARTRGLLLMAISNKFGAILLNTSNKSEAAVGYGTLYGDMNGGLSVLGDVYKTDVFALAKFMNKDGEVIPNNIITKPPSAELRPDQKDSDSLPEYDVLDAILYQYIELKSTVSEIMSLGYDEALIRKTISMVNKNEFKRFQTPPILRVSSKAFGMGRRMPLVAKY